MLLIKSYETSFQKKATIFGINKNIILSFGLKHFSRIIFIYNISTFKTYLGGHLKIMVGP